MRIKKVMSFFFCLLFCFILCSCSQNKNQGTITMEQIIEANSNEMLLSKYNSFSLFTKSGERECEYFVNPNLCYSYDDVTHEVVNKYGHYCKTEDGLYSTVLYAGVEPIDKDENLLVSEDTTLQEEIIECIYEKDEILLKTRLSSEIYAQYKADDETDLDGDYLEIDYVLNGETLEIISMTETVRKEDGTEVSVITSDVAYNKTMPVVINDILKNIKVEKMSAEVIGGENKVRTVEIVLDPGTQNEQSYSVEVLQGNTVSVVRPNNYKTIFADRSLTTKFEGDIDLENDLTIYSANGK